MTSILASPPKNRRFDTAAAIAYAANARGVTALRIGVECVLLLAGRGKLPAREYFLQGAWQPGIPMSERRAFLGARAVTALNTALNPLRAAGVASILTDKLACHARFSASGLPQPRILAVAARLAPVTDEAWLASPGATLAFLAQPDVLPCFGKPIDGSHAEGGVSIMARTAEGRLVLGNGHEVEAEALVEEIWRSYGTGYMFQELVRPHEGLAALVGPVIGSTRIVTVKAGNGPEVLYAVQRAPAAGQMVDSSTGRLGTYAAVDPATGQVIRAQARNQMGAVDLLKTALTGAVWPGAQLPGFSRAAEIAVAAHAAFPEHGICGSDIFLSDRGPIITEINVNPDHYAYQTAHARGILNPEFAPRLRAVRDRFRDLTPRPKHCPLA